MEAPQFPERVAAVVQRIGVVRVECESAIVAGERVSGTSKFHERVPAIVERFGKIGPDGQRAREALQRIVELFQALQHQAAVTKESRIVGLVPDGTIDQLESVQEVIALRLNQSQQVKGRSMFRIFLQDPEIQGGRFSELASLMECDRALKTGLTGPLRRERPYRGNEPIFAGEADPAGSATLGVDYNRRMTSAASLKP